MYLDLEMEVEVKIIFTHGFGGGCLPSIDSHAWLIFLTMMAIYKKQKYDQGNAF
jgi:hypothetical protein